MELEFRDRIKELRTRAKMTQKEFAEKAKISVAAYAAYEQGPKLPSLEIAVKIAQAFNVSLDWLCGLKGEHSDGVPKSVGDIIKMFINMSLTTMYFDIKEEVLRLDQVPNLPKQYERFASADEKGVHHIDQAVFKCADPDLSSFFQQWVPLYKLYKDSTIGENVYLLWANDQINKYSRDALDLIERIGM